MKGKKIITVALILLIAIGLITTGISAANLIGADSVQYKDTTVKAALDDLMDKVSASACKDGALCSKVKLGDYITMTPTSTLYNISKELTGYSSDQTINPSELNKWRVIDIHEDGTIDMVSQYVSSTSIYFLGQIGYLNLVGALNEIAKQYENSNYTVGSRHMGYNVQTEYITDASIFTYPPPLGSSTYENRDESLGRGDTLYAKDTGLVTAALGKLKSFKVGTGTPTSYWLASRYYRYVTSNEYRWFARSVDGGIDTDDNSIGIDCLYYYYWGWNNGDVTSRALRPIVTLKSDINEVSGSGTSSDPWVLG